MSKVIIVFIIVLVIALGIAGVLYWNKKQKGIEIADGVFLPIISPATENPASVVPDINPVERANPFGSTYQNPFE